MANAPPSAPLPEAWLIEAPPVLEHARHPLTAFEALLRSRKNLVQLMTLSSGILLVHLFASRSSQKVHAWRAAAVETGSLEKPWLPRSEGSKSMSYVGFTAILTAGALLLKAFFVYAGLNVWPGLHDHSARWIGYPDVYNRLELFRRGSDFAILPVYVVCLP